jgi:hypothetical protein
VARQTRDRSQQRGSGTSFVTSPPAVAPPASCYPKTSSGNCYEPGEFCRTTDHGIKGIAGNGEAITCKDNGWRREPA